MSEVSVQAAYATYQTQTEAKDIHGLCRGIVKGQLEIGHTVTQIYTFVDAAGDVQLYYVRQNDGQTDLRTSPHVRQLTLIWERPDVAHDPPSFLVDEYAKVRTAADRDEAELAQRKRVQSAAALESGFRLLLPPINSVKDLVSWASPDGTRRLAAGGITKRGKFGWGGTIHIWDPDNGESFGNLVESSADTSLKLTGWATASAGFRLASGHPNGDVFVWDANTATEIGHPECGSSEIRSLTAWTTPDGRSRLAAGDSSGIIRVWDGDTLKPVGKKMRYPGDSLQVLTAWSDSRGRSRLAAGGDANIWIDDPDKRWSLPKSLPARGLTFALTHWNRPDGVTCLASGGDDNRISLWHTETGKELGSSYYIGTMVVALTHGDTSRLVSNDDKNKLQVWNPNSGSRLRWLDMSTVMHPSNERASALTSWLDATGAMMLAVAFWSGQIIVTKL